MLSYQVAYRSLPLIICVTLRISLRNRHDHRFLYVPAVEQKLDMNTEQGKKMRSSHTWLLPFPSFPNAAGFHVLPEDGGSSALRVIILDPGMGVAGHLESFLKSSKLTLHFTSCQEVGSAVPGLSQKGLGGAWRNRENVQLSWPLPPQPWGAGRR